MTKYGSEIGDFFVGKLLGSPEGMSFSTINEHHFLELQFQPVANGCLVISNHFPGKNLVHHPIEPRHQVPWISGNRYLHMVSPLIFVGFFPRGGVVIPLIFPKFPQSSRLESWGFPSSWRPRWSFEKGHFFRQKTIPTKGTTNLPG